MKKNKLIALVASLSMVATYVVSGVTSVFAANTPEFILKYNDNGIVDVYFANIADSWNFNFVIDIPETITAVTFTPEADVKAAFDNNDAVFENQQLKATYVSSGDGMTFNDNGETKVGSFSITIADDSADIVLVPSYVNIDDLAEVSYSTDLGNIIVAPLTIPGAKPADETVAATSVGTFNEWTEEAAVAAFTATLTAEQAAKTVTWNVTDGTTTKTQATTVDTTISGENDVVIGLMVKNAVAGLSASVVVK